MTRERLDLGQAGEELAVDYLQSLGWRILARNVHYRVAELDIVAEDAGVIVFVEVRTLFRKHAIRAVDTVRWSKHRKLTRAARMFLQREGYLSWPARFDVIGVDGRRRHVVDHVVGAFEAASY